MLKTRLSTAITASQTARTSHPRPYSYQYHHTFPQHLETGRGHGTGRWFGSTAARVQMWDQAVSAVRSGDGAGAGDGRKIKRDRGDSTGPTGASSMAKVRVQRVASCSSSQPMGTPIKTTSDVEDKEGSKCGGHNNRGAGTDPIAGLALQLLPTANCSESTAKTTHDEQGTATVQTSRWSVVGGPDVSLELEREPHTVVAGRLASALHHNLPPLDPFVLEHPHALRAQIHKHLLSCTTSDDFSVRFNLLLRSLPLSKLPLLLSLHRHPSLNHLVSTKSYNKLLRFAYEDLSHYAKARGVLREMKANEIAWDEETWGLVAVGFAKLGKGKGVRDVLEMRRMRDVLMDAATWTALLGVNPLDTAKSRHKRRIPGHSDGLESIPSASVHWPHAGRLNMKEYVAGWKWGPPGGKEVKAVARRLLKVGQWDKAVLVVNQALQLKKLPLEKRGAARNSGAPGADWDYALPPAYGPALLRTLLRGARDLSNTSHPCTPKLDLAAFTPKFCDAHPDWIIRLDAGHLRMILHHDSSLPPSGIVGLVEEWTRNRGLDPESLGTRTAVSMLGNMCTWLNRVRGAREEETWRVERDVVWEWWNGQGKLGVGGHAMLKRGPIDGAVHRGSSCFWASQNLDSLQGALDRAEKATRDWDTPSTGTAKGGDETRRFPDAQDVEWDLKIVLQRDLSGKGQRVYCWWLVDPKAKGLLRTLEGFGGVPSEGDRRM